MSGPEAELIVIGAGPAGAHAAMTAAALGVRTVLIDDAASAGGQVYRAAASDLVPPTPEGRQGTALRRRLAGSGVDTVFGQTVWSVSGHFRVDTLGEDGPRHWTGQALIAATGAQERVVPFPGWTLPGVVGLAGATILLKAHGIAPGRRTLVAGSGPLLAAVAIGILKAGGAVAAVVDLASPRDWLSRLPAMAARPDLLARGAAWVARLRLAGVPLLFGHRITEVTPTADGLRAAIGRVDAAGALVPGAGGPTLEMDAVAVGNGLVPSTDISRLLRVDHRFDTDSQGWCPVLDGDGRSARAFFYVAGDAGGIHGAVPAALQGELAGLAAAHDLGRLAASAYRPRAERLRRELARARRFGAAMAGLMAPRPGQLADIPAATVVCRCEDVTRAEIEDAARDGACDVNQLKAWTRCGMGPCQGRMCGDTAAALLALHHGTDRDAAGLFTGRTPLRPLPLDVLTGTYGYADLRLPPPAPL